MRAVSQPALEAAGILLRDRALEVFSRSQSRAGPEAALSLNAEVCHENALERESRLLVFRSLKSNGSCLTGLLSSTN